MILGSLRLLLLISTPVLQTSLYSWKLYIFTQINLLLWRFLNSNVTRYTELLVVNNYEPLIPNKVHCQCYLLLYQCKEWHNKANTTRQPMVSAEGQGRTLPTAALLEGGPDLFKVNYVWKVGHTDVWHISPYMTGLIDIKYKHSDCKYEGLLWKWILMLTKSLIVC